MTVVHAGLSDAQLLDELGRRVRQERLNQNITQADIAERAGVGRQTVAAIERGHSVSLMSLIGILRGLGRIETLDGFLPDPGASPIQAMRGVERPRQRARQTHQEAEWIWGDD